MQYIVVVKLGNEIVKAVGHWSRGEGAYAWIAEQDLVHGYEYEVVRMYHPTVL